MAGIHFKEIQKNRLGWRWFIFIVLYVLMFWALFEQFAKEPEIESIIAISFSLLTLAIFNLIIITMHLETIITDEQISFQYKPFHRKPRKIAWHEVSDAYSRHYKPFREYGGHGIQTRIGKGKAFTVTGKNGLQLVLKSGKNILIGTQKPKELEMTLEKLKSRI